ncbi:hypothetical protein JTB14_020825 [Gonioctena quinquepunctata]|nr:hypothetical protein JTB14_020825 [Gonioctena quinquepunctata]
MCYFSLQETTVYPTALEITLEFYEMESKSTYFENISHALDKGLEVNQKKKVNLREDVNTMKKWAATQPHLPEIPNDLMITNFLLMNKFSIENVKQKIDMYYTMRRLFPEFFEDKHPLNSAMIENMDRVAYLPMPKATKYGYRVIVFHLSDDYPEFNVYKFFGQFFNLMEVRLQEDYRNGDIIIYDFENLTLGHLAQSTPTLIKNYSTILEKVFNSNIKQLHCLNYPLFAETFIKMSKRLLNPKLANRFHFHRAIETIADFVPLEILPKDYGGHDISLKEINEIWKRKFADYKDRFNTLDKLRVNEALRPIPLVNDEILGYYGNFKKVILIPGQFTPYVYSIESTCAVNVIFNSAEL